LFSRLSNGSLAFIPQVAASMLVFGIGAALPLLIIGLLSREALQRWRKQALLVSHAMKAHSYRCSRSRWFRQARGDHAR